MRATRPSMQELIGRRRRAGFVGRSAERAAFRANFDHSPEDERHRFLFHVHGNAGVGKTFLVREWEHMARECGALTAYVDESAGSIPEAMAAMSRQFASQGHRFRELERLLATHRERRHEAEANALAALEPQPQPQQPSAGSMAVARAGLVGLGMVPGVGAFAGALDAAQLAQSAERLRAGLSARFRDQEDVELVLSPERRLTPVLLGELSDAASSVPWIVLFFDTYERTGPLLDGWLHELMTTDRHGALPATVVVVTAGQHLFDTARWGTFADFMSDVPLGPFTEAEARGLLAGRGVVAEPVVAEVLRLTGGLPVLVSTLAEQRPADLDDMGDPSATAVERFLKWEQDPVRRSAALACALPRRLDADVFRAVVDRPDDELGFLYDWLRGLPFVGERGDRLQYHDVVRAPMLRMQRLRSPRDWTERHTRLAETFGQWRAETEADLPADGRWEDEGWRRSRLAETYHSLCARPGGLLPETSRDLVSACGEGDVVARRWAQTLVQAGEDADAGRARAWGSEILAALDRGGVLEALGILLAKGRLDARGRAEAHRLRGIEYGNAGDDATAMAQFDRAVVLDPESGPAYQSRAIARAHQRDYAGAVTDLDRADELAPDTAGTLARRGDYQRLTGDYEAAVRDLGRAVELDPARKTAWASRGAVRLMLQDLDGAISDLDHALELDPDYVWALVRRARVWRWHGDQERCLADLDRAVALQPDQAWVHCERGDALTSADRREEALVDYDRAIALDAEYASAYASRGFCRAGMGQQIPALADLDRALELDPEYVWALWQRARVHRALGSRASASADVQRALEVDPDHWMAQFIRFRKEAKRLLGGDELALFSWLKDWLETDPSAPLDLGGVATALGVPEGGLAETVERLLEMSTDERADLAQRLTEVVTSRDELLELFD